MTNGIRTYKDMIRTRIPQPAPFYPLGMPDVTNRKRPVALGMRSPGWTAIAVWRLEGDDVRFPPPKMACIVVL